MRGVWILTGLVLALGSGLEAQRLERPPNAELREQWQWALRDSVSREDARGYWVGFSFPRLMRSDRYVISGGWRQVDGWRGTGGPSLSRWIDRGDSYADLEADPLETDATSSWAEEYAIKQIAVILGFPPGDGIRGADRATVRNTALAFDPEGRPLVWLGAHPVSASFAFLRELYDAQPAPVVREEVATAAGLHDLPLEVVPFLDAVLLADDSAQVRDEAVSALRHFPNEASVRLLSRTLAQDPSGRVQVEAVGVLADFAMPSAERALIAVALESDVARVRREAAESLGRRSSAAAASALERVALDDPEAGVQRAAVEAMGDLPQELAVPLLRRMLADHASERVRRQTVETLAGLPGETGLDSIIEVAERDSSRSVRREAFEQLATSAAERALAALHAIANDESDDLSRHAIEALVESEDGIVPVIEIARTHRNAAIRRRAILALGDSADPRARQALIAIVRDGLRR